jgi:hypothetical protein
MDVGSQELQHPQLDNFPLKRKQEKKDGENERKIRENK